MLEDEMLEKLKENIMKFSKANAGEKIIENILDEYFEKNKIIK